MASFQNTFCNERGITPSSSSSNSTSTSTSTSSSSQEFYYDDDDNDGSNSIVNIIYRFFWGSIPTASPPPSLSRANNDACSDLRN